MSTVSAGSLFNVDGIVAVVTGGGTGRCIIDGSYQRGIPLAYFSVVG